MYSPLRVTITTYLNIRDKTSGSQSRDSSYFLCSHYQPPHKAPARCVYFRPACGAQAANLWAKRENTAAPERRRSITASDTCISKNHPYLAYLNTGFLLLVLFCKIQFCNLFLYSEKTAFNALTLALARTIAKKDRLIKSRS